MAYDHLYYSSHILRLIVNTEMNQISHGQKNCFNITGRWSLCWLWWNCWPTLGMVELLTDTVLVELLTHTVLVELLTHAVLVELLTQHCFGGIANPHCFGGIVNPHCLNGFYDINVMFLLIVFTVEFLNPEYCTCTWFKTYRNNSLHHYTRFFFRVGMGIQLYLVLLILLLICCLSLDNSDGSVVVIFLQSIYKFSFIIFKMV